MSPWTEPWDGLHECTTKHDCALDQVVFYQCLPMLEYNMTKSCVCDPHIGRSGALCMGLGTEAVFNAVVRLFVIPLTVYTLCRGLFVLWKLRIVNNAECRTFPDKLTTALLFAIIAVTGCIVWAVSKITLTLSDNWQVVLSAHDSMSAGVGITAAFMVLAENTIAFGLVAVASSICAMRKFRKGEFWRVRILVALALYSAVTVGATVYFMVTRSYTHVSVCMAVEAILNSVMYAMAYRRFSKEVFALCKDTTRKFLPFLSRLRRFVVWICVANTMCAGSFLAYVAVVETIETFDDHILQRARNVLITMASGSICVAMLGVIAYVQESKITTASDSTLNKERTSTYTAVAKESGFSSAQAPMATSLVQT